MPKKHRLFLVMWHLRVPICEQRKSNKRSSRCKHVEPLRNCTTDKNLSTMNRWTKNDLQIILQNYESFFCHVCCLKPGCELFFFYRKLYFSFCYKIPTASGVRLIKNYQTLAVTNNGKDLRSLQSYQSTSKMVPKGKYYLVTVPVLPSQACLSLAWLLRRIWRKECSNSILTSIWSFPCPS